MSHYRVKTRKKSKQRKILFALVFLLLALLLLFEFQFRPLLETVAATQAKQMFTQALNVAVEESLLELGVDYSSLVTLSQDEGGKVLALNTNMALVNTLKTQISQKVQEQMLSDRFRQVQIPLGTLLGSQLFRDIGPRITFQFTLSGSVLTDFQSAFVSAGINQTKHQLYLQVSTGISVLAPGNTVSTEVESSVLVAETVIVGEVPEVYADLNTENASDIADFSQLIE